MAKWNKKTFIDDLRKNCSREVAKIGLQLVDFAENHSDNLSWGRGSDHGTMTFRCDTDQGLVPLFHLSSEGKINILLNSLRSKGLPKQVIHDMSLKLESNFLRDYDPEMYPVDVFEPMNHLFHTNTQVEKFIKTVEGCVYRLKQ
jgi:hypothetical protein